MYWYIFWQPNADPEWLRNYWKNGQEGRVIQYPFSSFPENPYAISYEFLNKSNRNGVTGNIQATYNFTKELSLQLRTALDFSYEQREQDRPYDAGTKLPKGSFRTQNIYSQEASSDFLLRYNKKVVKDLELTATAGGSMVQNRYNRDEIRADSLIYPQIYSFSNAAGTLVSLPYKSKFNVNSFYGVFSAAYKDYLYLDLTGRSDWTSVLATPLRTDNVSFFYPSASLSFIASDLFKLPTVINLAKLRASYSQVGSGGTTSYLTAYTYPVASGGLFPGGALQNPSVLTNSNLRPLRTTAYEVGADIRLFKSRLNFDLALYAGNTKDQILYRIVDRAVGYNQIVINAGQVNNRGIELAVNGTPVQTKDGFKWSANFTFAANKNKIIDLDGDTSVVLRNGPVAGGQIVAKVGGSMGDMYGRGFVRSPDGQIVYDETTGVAKITDDVVFLGNTIPRYKLSLGSEFSYRRFRLNVLFDAQVGGVAHSLMNYKLVEQGKTANTLPGRYNGIIGDGVIQNPDGTYRKNDVIAFNVDNYYRAQMGADNAEGSTFSTNFVKFREARLDYTLSPKLLKQIGLQRATIGAYGRNLYIWSPWPMFDPEFGTLAGTDIVQGFETGQFPSTRTFGLNLVIGI
ncbi:SusC/RagA family TonB-linked outer membrane protein [Pedobacter chinensis]|uniref:TonB-dependent receptor n=1 Tax=Pedobacter chinensis TaxID=2282421 RepID=UPI001F199A58|nr:TonB-dependent receptor [Pedobacter chinensis]